MNVLQRFSVDEIRANCANILGVQPAQVSMIRKSLTLDGDFQTYNGTAKYTRFPKCDLLIPISFYMDFFGVASPSEVSTHKFFVRLHNEKFGTRLVQDLCSIMPVHMPNGNKLTLVVNSFGRQSFVNSDDSDSPGTMLGKDSDFFSMIDGESANVLGPAFTAQLNAPMCVLDMHNTFDIQMGHDAILDTTYSSMYYRMRFEYLSVNKS